MYWHMYYDPMHYDMDWSFVPYPHVDYYPSYYYFTYFDPVHHDWHY